jgi:hypothetical protein
MNPVLMSAGWQSCLVLSPDMYFGPGHFSNERVNQDLIRHEPVGRNSEFGTSGGFEFPDERA